MFGRRVGTLGKVSKPDVLGLELLKLLHRHALVAATRRNRSLSGVLSPPAPTRNNPSHFHEGGVGSDQGDSDQQQVAAP